MLFNVIVVFRTDVFFFRLIEQLVGNGEAEPP